MWARSSLIRVEDERLKSEKDRRRKDGIGAMFLEKSDLDVLHRLKLPKIIWPSAEQHFDVNGLHGFEGSEDSLIVEIRYYCILK